MILAPTTAGLPLVTAAPPAVVTRTVANDALTGSLNSRTTSVGAVVSRAFCPGVILTSSACAAADVALIIVVRSARPRAEAATAVARPWDIWRSHDECGRRIDEWDNISLIVPL